MRVFKKTVFEKFIGKKLRVGVPNNNTDGIFNHYGILVEVCDDYIQLQNDKNGSMIFVLYQHILEFEVL